MPYEYDGVQYPSVTTITGMLDKPALLGWAARMACDYVRDNFDKACDPTDNHALDDVLEGARKAHTERRDSAADAGKLCHKAIELLIGGNVLAAVETIEGNDEATKGYEAFLDWTEANDVEMLESECQVFSLFHGYAGRFDVVAKVNGVKYLIDFKTSSGVYDEMRYQLCAYRQAYNEGLKEGQEPIDKIAVLHLDKKDGSYTWHEMSKDMERYTELFNTLTRAYYLMKNRRLKNNPFVKAVKEIGKPIEIKLEGSPF